MKIIAQPPNLGGYGGEPMYQLRQGNPVARPIVLPPLGLGLPRRNNQCRQADRAYAISSPAGGWW